MSTYNSIVKNIAKTDNNIFLSYNDNVDGIIKIFFINLLKNEINIKNKFIFFKETLDCFILKGGDIKRQFIDYFCKIQKTYNVLNRFIYNYKYKKSKVVVNTDMYLNELNTNNSNVISLFDNNLKYLFIASDLIKIIDTALTNSYMFFSEPLSVKNPYNNLPFNKSVLYNIYFFIRYKTQFYSELFFKFFSCDFNMYLFKNKNEYLLRDYSIKNFVYKSSNNILIDEINEMIILYNNYRRHLTDNKNKLIKIDKEFPKEKLIQIMRPYLLLYCISQYSLVQTIKRYNYYLLINKLNKFYSFNPNFGRKKYKISFKYNKNFKKVISKIIDFDDKHIKFNDNETQNIRFLIDHLSYHNEYDNTNVTLYEESEDESDNSNNDTESTNSNDNNNDTDNNNNNNHIDNNNNNHIDNNNNNDTDNDNNDNDNDNNNNDNDNNNSTNNNDNDNDDTSDDDTNDNIYNTVYYEDEDDIDSVS